jgi:hypothetical protein
MRKRDVLAGALLLNALPHTITGLAGKRFLTPLGGASSSPGTNLAWAGLNVAAGLAATDPAGWRAADQRTAEERLRGVLLGAFGMAALGVAYELTPAAARRRRERAPT